MEELSKGTKWCSAPGGTDLQGLPAPGAELSKLIPEPWAEAAGSAHQPLGPSPAPLRSLRGISQLPQAWAASMCYLLHSYLPERARFPLGPASVFPILNFFPSVEKLNELLYKIVKRKIYKGVGRTIILPLW